jgi:hypothetical protein
LHQPKVKRKEEIDSPLPAAVTTADDDDDDDDDDGFANSLGSVLSFLSSFL